MSEALPPEYSSALARTAARRTRFGCQVYYFSETGSTNDIAGTLAERGAPEGTTVVASAQSAGRGRHGREWFSPPGAGLYVSVICRNAAAAPLLTLAGGVAVADGIRAATALPVCIKWPNDIVIEPPPPASRRKLAGILAEGSSGSGGVQYVVLGFGINLRSTAYPPAIALRATSIEAELGRAPDPGAVLAETLASLDAAFVHLSSGEPAPVLDRWRALAPSCKGARVERDTPGGALRGVTEGLSDDGALLVRTAGRVERIISGEVRWL